MSQRSVEWKKKLRQTGGQLDRLLPTGAVGRGTYLSKQGKEPHGLRGEGTVCSKPIGTTREARLRSMKL